MAAASRNQTSAEGSLYELVARGVKDKFFILDDKEATHPFSWSYDRWPALAPEERRTVPLNPAKFGQRCEFEFDLPGDVLTEASLLIELPTWLPPEMARYNSVSNTYSDTIGHTYGYVNGIAYFLFQRIELYQDGVLLQEVSGDSLYVSQLTRSSLNQAFLTQTAAGIHDGSSLGIMRNATPGTLELPLPMIGCSWPGDRGLPVCGLRKQTFRLRVTLRKLEDLVETTTDSELHPKPWLKTFTQIRTNPLSTLTDSAIPIEQIGQPTLTLRTRQLYLLNDARSSLEQEHIEVPYIRYFDNVFSINQPDYAPIERGATATLTKQLDANFTVERILLYFRNQSDIAKNRLWKFSNSAAVDGQYYTSIQLIIAGQLREGPWSPEVWQTLVPLAKEERTSSKHVCVMNWGRGWRHEDVAPAIREPTGGINFTTADRPTLLLTLADISIDPELGYKQSHFVACCESWGLYTISKQKGRLEYAN